MRSPEWVSAKAVTMSSDPANGMVSTAVPNLCGNGLELMADGILKREE
jgi:hypothetical protein